MKINYASHVVDFDLTSNTMQCEGNRVVVRSDDKLFSVILGLNFHNHGNARMAYEAISRADILGAGVLSIQESENSIRFVM